MAPCPRWAATRPTLTPRRSGVPTKPHATPQRRPLRPVRRTSAPGRTWRRASIVPSVNLLRRPGPSRPIPRRTSRPQRPAAGSVTALKRTGRTDPPAEGPTERPRPGRRATRSRTRNAHAPTPDEAGPSRHRTPGGQPARRKRVHRAVRRLAARGRPSGRRTRHTMLNAGGRTNRSFRPGHARIAKEPGQRSLRRRRPRHALPSPRMPPARVSLRQQMKTKPRLHSSRHAMPIHRPPMLRRLKVRARCVVLGVRRTRRPIAMPGRTRRRCTPPKSAGVDAQRPIYLRRMRTLGAIPSGPM